MFRRSLISLAVCLLASVAFAQELATAPALGYEDSFQIAYLPNFEPGTFVNITNAGFHSDPAFMVGAPDPHGWICANVYVYDQDEQPRNCCACPVSQNGLKFLTGADLAPTIFPAGSPSVVVKIIATRSRTVPGPGPAGCAANAPGPPASPFVPTGPGTFGGYATGLRAWATHVHHPTATSTFYTETKFEEVPLSAVERDKLIGNCAFINFFGSGFGICHSCAEGARRAE